MRTSLIALMVIVFMCFASVALAGEAQTSTNETQGPVMMTDAQLDNIVAAGPPAQAWGYNSREETSRLVFVPGTHQQATPQFVGDAVCARPYNEDRTNGNSNRDNAKFGLLAD